MNHSFRRSAALALCTLLFLSAIAQVPSGNPLSASIRSPRHWTNAIPWKKVTEAAKIPGLVDTHNRIDSAVLVGAMQKIASGGGGVLYFSRGTYQLGFNLPLYDGVILRGEDPEGVSDTSAGTLPTRFVFPRLVSPRGSNGPEGETVSKIPFCIYPATEKAGLLGLVNLDINRATILLTARKKDEVLEAQFASLPQNSAVGNVLLYGIRQNNAAMLDPAVPSAFQVKARQGWQIWPNNAIANVNIQFDNNCLIANCRLNDGPTDNIRQFDYMTDDGMRFDGSISTFRFTDHPGLVVMGKNADSKAELFDNSIFVSKGHEPMSVEKATVAASRNNRTSVINEGANNVTKGLKAADQNYNLLYSGAVPSEERMFYSEYGDTLAYRLVKPLNYDPSKKYPVVVYLHDFWEKGGDNRQHLRQFIWQLVTPENREKFPCFIIAPQLPASEPKWKTEGMGSETWPIQCTSWIVDSISAAYSIDPARLYLTGNSMGGAGAVNLAMKYPGKFAGIVSVSMFYVMTENMAAQVRNIPMWLIFGAEDEKIRPLTRQTLRSDLKLAKANFTYSEIPGMGHRCWNAIGEKMPEVFTWLFAQRNK